MDKKKLEAFWDNHPIIHHITAYTIMVPIAIIESFVDAYDAGHFRFTRRMAELHDLLGRYPKQKRKDNFYHV